MYVGQIYTDSLVHDAKALQFLVSVIGEVSLLVFHAALCTVLCVGIHSWVTVWHDVQLW